MPKERSHVAEAQKQRQKIKQKSLKYVPSTVTLQVLGTGADGAPRSIYIFSDQGRYLFNCGEGTQRLAHEHKMKLAKLEHIFVTQSVWKNIGGLPGTALTIQDVGVPKITLHGPSGLIELFRATRKFVVMKDLQIEMANCAPQTAFKDNMMTVKYVPIIRRRQLVRVETVEEEIKEVSYGYVNDKSVQINTNVNESCDTSDLKHKIVGAGSNKYYETDSNTSYYGHENKVFRFRGSCNSKITRDVPDTNEVSEDAKSALMYSKIQGIVMCYVCKLHPRPGTLDLDKCVKKGVPPGPMLGQLKAGVEIKLANNVTVKPSDVCEPDDPGPVFLVVDCPNEDFLESLTQDATLKMYQASAKKEDDLAYLIVHFTPQRILEHPQYREWINKFSASTQHLFVNDGNVCLGSMAVHRIQHKLNLLSNEIFPLLKHDKLLENGGQQVYPDLVGRIIHPNTFASFRIRPKLGYDVSSQIKLNPNEYVNETMSLPGFADELKGLKKVLKEKRKSMTIRPYPKLLFLGTGSCIPNKTRNTSGILLQTSDTSNILIDCGEGTYGQIVRFFGERESRQVLAHIDAIYISHLHADHHIGLIGMLKGRHIARRALQMQQTPVYLFAPKQISNWLDFYDDCFEDIKVEYELVPNGALLKNSHSLDHVKETEILKKLNMHAINTCFVKHCLNAFGVSFHHKLGKITYSGDTLPCEKLIELGMNSDLLIHEATMEDDLAQEAIIKMHSTTSQAISVGQKMLAKSIILTHFSQRYAKLPRFNDNFSDNVGIAFDNMMITLDELPLMPLLYPALKLMFAEHYEEMETKAIKRQRKQQLQVESSNESQ